MALNVLADHNSVVEFHRLGELRQRIYFYADDLRRRCEASDSGTGTAGGDDGDDGHFDGVDNARGATRNVPHNGGRAGGSGFAFRGKHHHGSSSHDRSLVESCRLFYSVFTAMGDLVSSMLHHCTLSKDAHQFKDDIAPSLYLLAMQINGLSNWDMCPSGMYHSMVTCLAEIDEHLMADRATESVTAPSPASTAEKLGGGIHPNSSHSYSSAAAAAAASMGQPQQGGTTVHPDVLALLEPCDALIHKLLFMTHSASKQRRSSFFDNLSHMLRQLLVLEHYEDARTAAWFLIVSVLISIVYIVAEIEELQNGVDGPGMRLVVPATMLLSPIVSGLVMRLLLPSAWVQSGGVLVRGPAVLTSLGVGLAWGSTNVTEDSAYRRCTAVLMAYLACLWTLANTAVMCFVSAGAFVLGSLIIFRDGYTTEFINMLLFSLCMGIAVGSYVAALLPPSPVPFANLLCSQSLTHAITALAGGQQMKNGLLTPQWLGGVQSGGEEPHNRGNPLLVDAGGSAVEPQMSITSSLAPSKRANANYYDVVMLLQHAAQEAGGLTVVMNADGAGGGDRGSRSNSFGLESGAAAPLHLSGAASLGGSTTTNIPSSTEGDVIRAGRVLDALMLNVAAAMQRRLVTQGGPQHPSHHSQHVPTVVFHCALVYPKRQNNVSASLAPTHVMLWCDEMSAFTPTTIAAIRLETAGSGLSFEYAKDSGLVMRYRIPLSSGNVPAVLRLPILPNEGEETVLIVHPSASVRFALSQWFWDQGIAVCVAPSLTLTPDTSVATYAAVVLPHEAFFPGAAAEDVDMLTIFPFAFVCALSLTANAPRLPPTDSLHLTLRGLPSHASLGQYRRLVTEVRLRASTRYLSVAPSLFHSPAPMRRLGQGSVGVVHKVRLEDGSFAAMKVMRSRLLLQNNITPEQCAEEERRKMTLSHPNIVNVHRVDRITALGGGGEVIVFSELCSDVTLRSLLQCGPLTHQEAALITVQLLHGLDYLHRSHSFAGDLKSENILFGPLRRVKIADYSSHFTTMNWRAPEFLSVPPTTAAEREAADVWALGCVQLEMLFGNDYMPTAATSALTGALPTAPLVSMERSSTPAGSSPVPRGAAAAASLLETARMHFRLTTGSSLALPAAPELDHILPQHTFPEWRSFILDCLEVDPHRRPRMETLLRHRFVNSVSIGFQQLPPMPEGLRNVEQRNDRATRSQSSGGGGSSVNWPKAESDDCD